LPKYEKVVADTVTISNFIKVGKLDLVCELYSGSLCVTEAVVIELSDGDIDITDWIEDGRIKKVAFQYDADITKEISAARLCRRYFHHNAKQRASKENQADRCYSQRMVHQLPPVFAIHHLSEPNDLACRASGRMCTRCF